MSLAALKKRRLANPDLPTPQKQKTSHSSSSTMDGEDESPKSSFSSQGRRDSHSQSQLSVYNMDSDQRQKYFKKLFANKVEPLALIEPPDEMTIYPEFKGEILDAYLHWTTFSVKIWTNYDTAANKFYIDEQRTNTCGKIIFSPQEREYLHNFDPKGKLQIRRLRFEIGTPFTDLAYVKIQAVMPLEPERRLEIETKLLDADSSHPAAEDFVKKVCLRLDNMDLTTDGEQYGFKMDDLEEIARHFYRQPTETMLEKLSWSSNTGVWMDVHHGKQENEGFIDFDAMEKGCSVGCDGCQGHRTRTWWTGGYSGYLTSSRHW